MQKLIQSIFAFLLINGNSQAQNPFELGAEYIRSSGKGYSTTKVAARGESFNNKNSFSAGITYQLASAKAYSVSTGFGMYVGYRHSPAPGYYSHWRILKEKQDKKVYW